jgi:hypothetical protein
MKEFDEMWQAFDWCRERNSPAIVMVAGKKWKIYPSGAAHRVGVAPVSREMTHLYAWRNNEKRIGLFKRECRVVARGAMNSVLVEFADGQREVVSRNAIRLKNANH